MFFLFVNYSKWLYQDFARFYFSDEFLPVKLRIMPLIWHSMPMYCIAY